MVLDQQCSADLQVIARLLLVCVCGGRVRGGVVGATALEVRGQKNVNYVLLIH